MLFLIEYDRKQGSIVAMQRFADADRAAADDARLELELRRQAEGVIREIVVLQATSEAAIRKTHSRYFETLDEMFENALQSTR